MALRYVRCRCGQALAVPAEPPNAVRCGACGAVLSVGGAEPPHGDVAPDQDTGTESAQPATRGNWFADRGAPAPAGAARTTRRRVQRIEPEGDTGRPDSMPGDSVCFFKWSALGYPLLHPNWIRWLGLSFVTTLAGAVVATTLFVAAIVGRFGLIGSVFTVSAMAMVCLALVSYVIASFVSVIEESANGEDRLHRLPDMNWWEILPPFMRTLGAAAGAASVTIGATYPLRNWFRWNDPELLIVQAVIVFQLFPILLLTNLADCSWVPIRSLLTTLGRLAHCPGYFAAFLGMTGAVTVGSVVAVVVLFRLHIALGLATAGWIVASWLMFYGHWLGRLVRKLAQTE